MQWVKNNIVHIGVYLLFLTIIIWLLSYRPDDYETRYKEALKKIEQRNDSIKSIYQTILERDVIIDKLEKEKDSSLRQIERLESQLKFNKQRYEKIINAIDTMPDSELQLYFSTHYPDTISSEGGN